MNKFIDCGFVDDVDAAFGLPKFLLYVSITNFRVISRRMDTTTQVSKSVIATQTPRLCEFGQFVSDKMKRIISPQKFVIVCIRMYAILIFAAAISSRITTLNPTAFIDVAAKIVLDPFEFVYNVLDFLCDTLMTIHGVILFLLISNMDKLVIQQPYD